MYARPAGSFFNKSNRTINTSGQVPVAAKSRLSTRSDVYDNVPSSPSRMQRSSPSSSGTPRAARNAVASTSRQRIDPIQEPSSTDDEGEQIQSTLTRSAQAKRRRSSVQTGQHSSSPSRDSKGKGRQSLFREPSSDQNHSRANVTGRTEAGYENDNNDNDDYEEQDGFQPALIDDEAGYNKLQQPYGDYPEPEDDEELDLRQEERAPSRRRAYSDDDEQIDTRRRQQPESDEEEPYQDIGQDDDDGNDSEELPPPLSEPGKKSSRAAANDSGHIEEEEEDARARSKGKTSQKPPSKPRKKYGRPDVEHPEGVRRSRRDRTSPVAFWRNEHVIYQRRDSPSGAAYYEKVGVADRPTGPVRSLVNKHKRSRSASAGPNKRAKTRSVSVATDNEGEVNRQGIDQDWAKWDEETDPDGIVWDYVDGKELQRRMSSYLQASFTWDRLTTSLVDL